MVITFIRNIINSNDYLNGLSYIIDEMFKKIDNLNHDNIKSYDTIHKLSIKINELDNRISENSKIPQTEKLVKISEDEIEKRKKCINDVIRNYEIIFSEIDSCKNIFFKNSLGNDDEAYNFLMMIYDNISNEFIKIISSTDYLKKCFDDISHRIMNKDIKNMDAILASKVIQLISNSIKKEKELINGKIYTEEENIEAFVMSQSMNKQENSHTNSQYKLFNNIGSNNKDVLIGMLKNDPKLLEKMTSLPIITELLLDQ